MKTFILLTAILFASFSEAAVRTVDADRFKLVSGPGAGFFITLPAVSSTVVLENGAQTLFSKDLISPNLTTPAITGGSVSGASILGGTVSGAAINAENAVLLTPVITGGSVSGMTSTNGILDNPTITGGSVSGGTNTNGVFNNPTIIGGTVSGVVNTNPDISGGTISGTTIIGSIIDAALNTLTNVSLTGSVSGVLPIANGGTNNASLSVSAGAVLYMDGSKVVANTAGVSGQVLVSQGTSAPVFVNRYTVQAIAASDIDWSATNSFTKTLSANTTFTFSNAIAGQNIVVRLTNTASNFTVTWPTVRWAGGFIPVMTVGAKSDVYTFYYDGTNYYGSAVQDMF